MKATGRIHIDDKWKKKHKEPSGPEFNGLPVIPDIWNWATIDQIADVQLGKMLDKKKHIEGRELSYLRNFNVRWGAIDSSNLRRMFFKDSELDRYAVHAGDVLVCEGGEPGRAAVWEGEIPGMMYQKALHRVRFFSGYSPKLLIYLLEYLAKSKLLDKAFTGSTINHFTRESFAKLPIPIVPIEEQSRIVEEVERNLSINQEVELQINQNLDRAESLRQSILQKAFSGKLVHAELTDEPASMLLERIRKTIRSTKRKSPSLNGD
jgi:type I restriction enzyme S subunit